MRGYNKKKKTIIVFGNGREGGGGGGGGDNHICKKKTQKKLLLTMPGEFECLKKSAASIRYIYFVFFINSFSNNCGNSKQIAYLTFLTTIKVH